MESTETATRYQEYKKPSWAPPSWLFGPVWSVLYIIIAFSFGNVGYWYISHAIPFIILFPFILNLIFNIAFTPIQFRLKNMGLATLDILLVFITLAWAMIAIRSYAPWVSIVNIPYLAWVSFASVLQITITAMNWIDSAEEPVEQ